MSNELVKWDDIEKQIDEAKDLKTIMQMQIQIEALKTLSKQVDGSLKTQNKCAKYKFYLEQSAGKLYKDIEKKSGGDRRSEKFQNLPGVKYENTLKEQAVNEAGKSYKTLNQWVRESDINKSIIEEYAIKCDDEEKDFTSKGCMRYAKQQEVKETPVFPKDKYTVIYADPPWEYTEDGLTGVSNKDEYGNVDKKYKQLSMEELCEMPIKDISADNAVLFLWVTSPFLYKVDELIREWGFNYKTSFIWDKQKHNFGYYNSVRHELLLIATKGSCRPQINKLYDSVISIKRGKHSYKPDHFRRKIDILYPNGKRIELFARKKCKGWDSWGNDIG